MMGEFEAIRPYSDAEVPAVLQRLLSDDAFLGALVRYRFRAWPVPSVGCSNLL